MQNLRLLILTLVSLALGSASSALAREYSPKAKELISQAEERLKSFEHFPDLSASDLMSEEVKWVFEYIAENPKYNDVAIVMDKPTAVMYVIAQGKLLGVTRFLYGMNKSDDFPGGSMAAAYILPMPLDLKKVTPAGYFPLQRDTDDEYGTSLTYSDYEDYRLAIHRVYRGEASEGRPSRLLTPSMDDKNISSGCVNVTDAFYDHVLAHLKITKFSRAYILPTNKLLFSKYFPMIESEPLSVVEEMAGIPLEHSPSAEKQGPSSPPSSAGPQSPSTSGVPRE